jgi:hypothetical protein
MIAVWQDASCASFSCLNQYHEPLSVQAFVIAGFSALSLLASISPKPHAQSDFPLDPTWRRQVHGAEEIGIEELRLVPRDIVA